jgi:hypothetical protein
MQMTGRMIAVAVLCAGCGDNDIHDDGSGGGGEFTAVDAPSTGTTFDVTLTPAMEVPACAAAGLYATGAATIRLTADDATVIVDMLTFSELSTPVVAAHIHWGPPGVAGPIVFPLGTTPPVTGTFTAANYPSPPPPMAPASFQAFVGEMKAGNTYVNVHTSACMPGEVRGQL